MEPVGRKTAEMQGLLLSFFFLIHFIPQTLPPSPGSLPPTIPLLISKKVEVLETGLSRQ